MVFATLLYFTFLNDGIYNIDQLPNSKNCLTSIAFILRKDMNKLSIPPGLK